MGMSISLRWVHVSPYPCFEIGKNSNLIKAGKTRQIGFGLGGYLWVRVLLPCLDTYLYF